MVNHQKDHLQCLTDQSRMSSIGSPTPLRLSFEYKCTDSYIQRGGQLKWETPIIEAGTIRSGVRR